MAWLFLAIAGAFFESIKDIFSKKSLQDIDSITVAFSMMFFTAIFSLPTFLIIPFPEIGDRFWLALLAGGIGNAIAFSLIMKALQISELSKVIPLTSLSPAFLLVTSPIIVGEFPNIIGVFGVLLIILGAYILNIGKEKIPKQILAPFIELSRDRGSKLALFVAFIWSLNANFYKIGVQNASPFFWITLNASSIAFLLSPFVLFRFQQNKRKLGKNLKYLIRLGFFNTLASSCIVTALSLTLVVYVIAVKRTSTILSVFWGQLIFKEEGLKIRLLGATIMVLGVFAIASSNT
ncbi:MAG: EamA family transporter [Cyanobacteria bacterium P01_E01_bin.42]